MAERPILRKRLTPLIRKTQPYTKKVAKAFGLSPHCWPKSNIARNQPKEKCGIPLQRHSRRSVIVWMRRNADFLLRNPIVAGSIEQSFPPTSSAIVRLQPRWALLPLRTSNDRAT